MPGSVGFWWTPVYRNSSLVGLCCNLPIAVYGVYQHVWRSHLTTTANQELRQATWAGLDASLTALPQRCELLICGDFNASLRREPNVVGPSVLAHSSTCDDHLQATYYSTTGSSQIDFVVTRQRMSGGPAKHAQPITTLSHRCR